MTYSTLMVHLDGARLNAAVLARSLGETGQAKRLGLYGFGASAHIVAQVAAWQGRSVYAFTKSGDLKTQDFARSLGAVWAADPMRSRPSRSTPLSCSPLSAIWRRSR